jgi:hypothetical protein
MTRPRPTLEELTRRVEARGESLVDRIRRSLTQMQLDAEDDEGGLEDEFEHDDDTTEPDAEREP